MELRIPSIGRHGFEGVVEVIFILEVVLGGHGLGEVAIDINSRRGGHDWLYFGVCVWVFWRRL